VPGEFAVRGLDRSWNGQDRVKGSGSSMKKSKSDVSLELFRNKAVELTAVRETSVEYTEETSLRAEIELAEEATNRV